MASFLGANAQDKAPVAPAAPVSPWKKKTEFGLNFNQGSFSNSWTGGGVNSIAFAGFFNSKGEYTQGKTNWVNDFQAQYGVLSNKGQSARKSIDRIFFDTKLAHKISAKWNLFGSLNFLSQFNSGYAYGTTAAGAETRTLISGLFAPAFITEAVGFEYKPNDRFNMQFAPLSMRQTIVADNTLYKTFPKNYGVEQGKTIRNEVGLLQVVTNLNQDIAKNVGLKFRHQLFITYDDVKAMDNRIDAQITAKVNKYLNVSFGTIIIYDQDQSYDIQFAQNLGVGFLYTF